MRFTHSKAVLGIAALAVALAFAAPASAQNKCSAGKVKCVDGKQKCKLGCHAKAEGKGVAVDAACLTKCEDKFDGGAVPTKGCFAKLESKQDGAKPETVCPSTGDTAALEAKVDAFVLDVVQELDPSFPTPTLNKCSAGKKKCVLKKVSAKLKCEGNNLKKPDPVKYGPCIQKAEDKFDGGADPTKGCFAKLESKQNVAKPETVCPTTGDTAALEAKVDAFVQDVVQELNPPDNCGNGTLDAGEDCDPPGSTGQCAALGAGNGNEVCTSQCKCQCPDKVTFRGDASSANSDLDTGWTGIAHDNKIVSNGDITVHIDSCANPSRPCGVCSFSGPIDNPGADAGSLNDRRCRNNSAVKCTSNGQCTGPGNACVYWFGAPLSLSSGGVATCVTNEVIGTLTGTANIETGTSASTLNLTSHVYTGVLTSKPCPKCTDAGGINDGVTGGTCTDGPRAGMACDANSESPIPAFGRTSLDCPPDSGSNIANLPIALGNSTGTESRSLSAASPDCSAFGFTGFKCPCDTCDDAASTPCSTDADCGGGTCGGLRCLVDAPTPGLPCSSQGTGSDPACCSEPTCTSGTIGTCDRPGEATKPNACSDGQCVSGGGTDDGMCHLAPSDNLCSVETFRSCTGNADCRPPGEGGTCADCAPGMQTCTTKRRECLLGIDDHLATHNGTINLHGMADTPVADVSHPILASMFCIGPTGSSSVNAVAGLPGLGKLRLNGTAQGLP